MNDTTLIKTGAVGAIVAALCCATPILVIALGAMGLSALTGYLDVVLLPILAISIGLMGYGLFRRRQNAAACCASDDTNTTAKGT